MGKKRLTQKEKDHLHVQKVHVEFIVVVLLLMGLFLGALGNLGDSKTIGMGATSSGWQTIGQRCIDNHAIDVRCAGQDVSERFCCSCVIIDGYGTMVWRENGLQDC
jgi:hypothetical protein